jgi:FemAB-related protein (PEP-CTERM system-associated)
VKILSYHDAWQEAWEQYVRSTAGATFFHSIRWKRVIERSFGYQACYFLAEEAGRVRGILPLFYSKSLLFGRSLISVPFGVYGGIVADDQTVEQALLETAEALARQLRVRYLELRHIDKHSLPLLTKDLYATFRREISGDIDQTLAAIPRKQRRMIRQGIKNGLQASVERDCLGEFYEIYAQSVKQFGTPVFPLRFFRHLCQEFAADCKVLSVWHEGKMVAGVMTFFFKDCVMPYYGGALRDYFPYAVNDFMYWELMRYGCEHGYRLFDFGRSKQGTGAYDFKRHWGFEPQPLCYQYYLHRAKTVPNLSPVNPKFQPFIEIWKRLPLSLTKCIGPTIVQALP